MIYRLCRPSRPARIIRMDRTPRGQHVDGRVNIPLNHLQEHIAEIPRDRRIAVRRTVFLFATFFLATLLLGCGGSTGSGGGGGSPVPAIPAGLVATAANAQVILSWTASSGATSYNVKRSTTSGGPYSQIGTPTTASFTDSGVTNGTEYFYVVSAANAAGTSANSAQVNATPSAVPAQLPGPSASLFANPPYTCVRNYYVATD